MDLRQAAERFRTYPRRLRTALAAAEMETAKDARRLAILYSSGSTSLADLRKLGHPYSLRAPQPGLFPSQFVNRQGGLFIADWQNPTQVTVGGVLYTSVINVDPVVEFLEGTSKMVSRPIGSQVISDLRVLRRKRLQAAVKKESVL